MTHPSELDEIERAVDRSILDKARAARIKKALHVQFDLTRPEAPDEDEKRAEASEDAEEFWDNVPL